MIPVFDMLMQHPDPEVRGRAIFSIAGLTTDDANYLGEIWHTHEEFLPFMVYQGERPFAELLEADA